MDKPGLIRLLGMATYLDKFCKNLATITRPLRDILKRNAAWIWVNQQKEAMANLKSSSVDAGGPACVHHVDGPSADGPSMSTDMLEIASKVG